MDQTKVTEQFAVVSGLSAEEAQQYEALVVLAIIKVEAMLRDKTLLDSYGDSLCYLAACVAFYNYICAQAAQDAGSFSAAESSVSPDYSARSAHAKELLMQATVSCSALLQDTDFVFAVIEGESACDTAN